MSSETQKLDSRYLLKDLPSNPQAEVRHFHPLSSGRDEFGNRLFSSPFSYFDRSGQESRASLLVSTAGEEFIKSHPGILRDVDQTLNLFQKKIENDEISLLIEEKPFIDCGPGRKMTWISSGGQSRTFLLETNNEKFIIQTLVSQTPEFTDFSQPYIHEMLQMQQLGSKLERDLQAARMEFPVFLFATGYVSCTQFVEGSHYIKADRLGVINSVVAKARSFIESQNKRAGSLWENIHVDTPPSGTIRTFFTNMIQTSDRVVWIDPFYYLPMRNQG